MKVYLIGRDGAWTYSLTGPTGTTRPTVGPFATQDTAKAAASLEGPVKRRLELNDQRRGPVEWIIEAAPAVYRIVLGGDGPSSEWQVIDFETDDALAAFEVRGFKPTGRVGGQHLRAELRGQPCFDGLAGPSWGGEENGKPVIRYENWKAYERLSA